MSDKYESMIKVLMKVVEQEDCFECLDDLVTKLAPTKRFKKSDSVDEKKEAFVKSAVEFLQSKK